MNPILIIITVLVSLFLIFMIGREFVSWYLKINKIVTLLEEIERNTRHFIVVKEKDKEPLNQ